MTTGRYPFFSVGVSVIRKLREYESHVRVDGVSVALASGMTTAGKQQMRQKGARWTEEIS
jgi:hypothetical protein